MPVAREEGLPSGKQGPIALSEVPQALAEILRVSEPGQVWPPRPAEGGWVIVQLEELQPAVFNQALKRDLALELGDRWLQECMEMAERKGNKTKAMTGMIHQAKSPQRVPKAP